MCCSGSVLVARTGLLLGVYTMEITRGFSFKIAKLEKSYEALITMHPERIFIEKCLEYLSRGHSSRCPAECLRIEGF